MNFNALLVEILGKRVVNLVHGYLGHRRGERPSTGRIRAPPALSLRTEATSVLTPTRQVISTAERFTIKPRMKRAMVARGAAPLINTDGSGALNTTGAQRVISTFKIIDTLNTTQRPLEK